MLRVSVETLIAEHGKWSVVIMALRAMARSKRQVQRVRSSDLPIAIRRDIGLPAIVDPPSRPMVLTVYSRF
ncbi:hypothetical protein [Pelagibacterium lacus]|uniref:Uncharacterized protein n=1 Tax=Pelagibacterium lacus TaxID=2282655 RepID=A0A369W0U9_9HYPH|nr:hypothetical protein [Pelagibacterium lacus]RDE07993.1 hypothetical protein DVH29_13720 [Pelagibacterium lacus]